MSGQSSAELAPSEIAKPAKVARGSNSSGAQDLTSQQIRERYRRLLTSAHFARAERLSVLLLHLLQERQGPHSGAVSERTIGVAVYGREPNWDPSIDPCVRVAIGRLRTRLAEYYETDGKDDHEQILLNKGSYLPTIITHLDPIHEAPVPAADNLLAPVGRSRRRLFTLVVLASCILLLAACFLLWMRGRPERSASSDFSIAPFATEMGAQFSPAISPDGNRIAYVWDKDQGSYDIYVRSIDDRSAMRLSSGSGNDFYPAWSPQGGYLAFLRNDGWQGRLIVHSMSNGSEKTVGTIGTAPGRWSEDSGPLLGDPGPVWSSDGSELIAFDQDHFGIYAISIATGARRQLTTDTQTTRDFYPQLSPDGKLLAYVHYLSHGVGDLYLLPMKTGGEPRQITHDQRTIRGITWSADGKSILIASNRRGPFELWRVSASTGAVESLPSDTSQAANPVVSPDGKWLAFDNAHESFNIEEAHLSATERPIQISPLIDSLSQNSGASLSPDGKRLLFISDRSGSWQIWLSAPNGTQMRQLTHIQDSYVGGISWSPDSSHAVFDARPMGHSSIFLLNVDTGALTKLSRGSAEERVPFWSPDGRSVYFSSDRDGSVALYRINLASGEISLVVNNAFRGEPTSDGKWFYFSTLFGELWRVPQAGGESVRLPDRLQPSSALTWTVVGNRLLVVRKTSASQPSELWEAKDDLLPVRRGAIMTPPGREVFSIDTSHDGLTLLAVTRYQSSDIILRVSPSRLDNERR